MSAMTAGCVTRRRASRPIRAFACPASTPTTCRPMPARDTDEPRQTPPGRGLRGVDRGPRRRRGPLRGTARIRCNGDRRRARGMPSANIHNRRRVRRGRRNHPAGCTDGVRLGRRNVRCSCCRYRGPSTITLRGCAHWRRRDSNDARRGASGCSPSTIPRLPVKASIAGQLSAIHRAATRAVTARPRADMHDTAGNAHEH